MWERGGLHIGRYTSVMDEHLSILSVGGEIHVDTECLD